MHVATQAEPEAEPRIPLSRQRVLRAAVKIADERGIDSLTMRRLAEELGAEAMSLYYHVANKEDVLDGIADAIATEINDAVDQLDVPSAGADVEARRPRRGSCPPARCSSATPGRPASSRRGPAPAWPCCGTTTACSGSCETAASPTT